MERDWLIDSSRLELGQRMAGPENTQTYGCYRASEASIIWCPKALNKNSLYFAWQESREPPYSGASLSVAKGHTTDNHIGGVVGSFPDCTI